MSPSRLLPVIRWTLVIPAALLGWYVAVFVTLLLASLATGLCPAEDLISGVCTADWFDAVETGLLALGAALAALLVVLLSSWTAPSHRAAVAITAFLVGSGFALWMAIETAEWLAFAAALLTGLLALRWMLHRFSGSKPV